MTWLSDRTPGGSSGASRLLEMQNRVLATAPLGMTEGYDK